FREADSALLELPLRDEEIDLGKSQGERWEIKAREWKNLGNVPPLPVRASRVEGAACGWRGGGDAAPRPLEDTGQGEVIQNAGYRWCRLRLCSCSWVHACDWT